MKQISIEAVYDVGIVLPDNMTDSTWDDMSQFMEETQDELGLEIKSSGCGMGIRDIQFHTSADRNSLSDLIRDRAKRYDLKLDYCSRYYQPTDYYDEEQVFESKVSELIQELYEHDNWDDVQEWSEEDYLLRHMTDDPEVAKEVYNQVRTYVFGRPSE